MPQFDENHVKINGGIIVWDGVTRPEQVTVGAKAGSLKYTLKVVFEPHNQDVQLFNQLAQKKLMESKWRGTLPAGGRMPVGVAGPDEFEGMFNGWHVIPFKTTLKAPDVYDENGAVVDPMRFSQVIYTGQKVDVLAHCYEYDASGNKGISAGLDAFAVIESAQAPRLAFAGGVDTASAFGGGGGGAPQGYGAPAPGGAPQGYGAPSQAQNFLPPAGGAPAPGGAPPPAAEVKYRGPDGNAYTEAQLQASGWSAAQVQALPRA